MSAIYSRVKNSIEKNGIAQTARLTAKVLSLKIQEYDHLPKIRFSHYLSTGERVFETPYGVQIIADGSVTGIEKMLIRGEYKNHLVDHFRSTVKEKHRMADIGANIGFYSILATMISGDDIVVDSFEPAPKNVYKFRKNIKLNNSKNINIYAIAIGNEDAEIKMNIPEGNEGLATISPFDWNEKQITQSIYSQQRSFSRSHRVSMNVCLGVV